MADLRDIGAAAEAVQDPQTSPEDLALITQCHPSLWVAVAAHPNAYPALLDWLRLAGGEAVAATVDARRPRPVPSGSTDSSGRSDSSGSPAAPAITDSPSEPSDPNQWLLSSDDSPDPPPALVTVPPPSPAPRPVTRTSRLITTLIGFVVMIVAIVIVVGAVHNANSPSSVSQEPAPVAQPAEPVAQPAQPVAQPAEPDYSHQWIYSVGGSAEDEFSDVAVTGNDSIIALGNLPSDDGDLAGEHRSDGSSPSVMVDTTGNLSLSDVVRAKMPMIATGYGSSIAVAGSGFQQPSGELATGVMLVDELGAPQWTTLIDNSVIAQVNDVALSPDGSVVVGGTIPDSSDSTVTHQMMAKIDASGALLWTQDLGTSTDWGGNFTRLTVASDGSIYAIGTTTGQGQLFASYSGASYGENMLAKISPDSQIEWVKTFGAQNVEFINGIAPATDGNILIAGSAINATSDQSGGDLIDAFVALVGPDGNIVWTRVDGGSKVDFYNAVAMAPDGGIVVAGVSEAPDGDFQASNPVTGEYGPDNAVVAKYGPNGQLDWSRNFGGTGPDSFDGVAFAPDGDVVAVGQTSSIMVTQPGANGQQNIDGLIVRLDIYGQVKSR